MSGSKFDYCQPQNLGTRKWHGTYRSVSSGWALPSALILPKANQLDIAEFPMLLFAPRADVIESRDQCWAASNVVDVSIETLKYWRKRIAVQRLDPNRCASRLWQLSIFTPTLPNHGFGKVWKCLTYTHDLAASSIIYLVISIIGLF